MQLVDDVEPYELMKLRLLNASHQALCYLGYLAGYRYAHEVCQDPLFVDFLLGYMEREGTPTLPDVPGVDLAAYQHQLIERFANPEVRDTLARLCAESSDRIPKWLRPGHPDATSTKGGEIERSALVVASLGALRRRGRRAGRADPGRRPAQGPGHGARPRAAGRSRWRSSRTSELFGDLVDDERFAETYTRCAGLAARASAPGRRWNGCGQRRLGFMTDRTLVAGVD